MLICDRVSLSASGKAIFSSASFTLLPGSITYLRGSNGSGKSSLLRMIAGIQKPGLGAISFYGYDINNIEKPYANYIGHNIGIKDELTVLENIRLWARLYDSEALIHAALYYFGLIDLMDTKAYKLSAGNRQKIALARLLSCESDLWLLDEVDAHLDAQNRALLNNAISSKAGNGGIVIITSHTKPEFKGVMDIDMEDFA